MVLKKHPRSGVVVYSKCLCAEAPANRAVTLEKHIEKKTFDSDTIRISDIYSGVGMGSERVPGQADTSYAPRFGPEVYWM